MKEKELLFLQERRRGGKERVGGRWGEGWGEVGGIGEGGGECGGEERKGKRGGKGKEKYRVTTINENKPRQRGAIPLQSSDDLSLQLLLESASTLSATEETHNVMS